MDYCALLCDGANNFYYFKFFETNADAVDYILQKMNVDKDSKWFHEDVDNTWVNEKDGKLYFHWMHEDYYEYDLLFKNYTDEKPTTIKELRKYLLAGNCVKACWASRAPIDYKSIQIKDAREEVVKYTSEESDIDNFDKELQVFYNKKEKE